VKDRNSAGRLPLSAAERATLRRLVDLAVRAALPKDSLGRVVVARGGGVAR